MANVSSSVIQLASFERTDDILFNAAYFGQEENLSGPSEAIIFGKPIKLGSGMFKIFYQPKMGEIPRKALLMNKSANSIPRCTS